MSIFVKTFSGIYYEAPHYPALLISILAIGFVSIFSLDAFDHGTASEQLFDFMMHLIPTFVLIIILAIAWKWELIGGIIYVLLGIFISPLI